MKTYHVQDLMVPISEYATVTENATLIEAVLALEKAQQAFDENRYRHRAILVLDPDGHVVGKLSQHDVIEALEPSYRNLKGRGRRSLERLGFDEKFIKSTLAQDQLWSKPLENLCQTAIHKSVRDMMDTIDDGEFIRADATMDEAIHRLILGRQHSLLVTTPDSGRKVVGVLRLTDVFEFVSRSMKQCEGVTVD